jgi:hypothetical protein
MKEIKANLDCYSHQSLEDVEDEDALFKELEEEDDQETSQFRERRFQEIQAEYDLHQHWFFFLAIMYLMLKSLSFFIGWQEDRI